MSVGGSVRRSASEKKTGENTGNKMKAAFLAAAVLAIAGVAFYFSTTVHAAKASVPKPAAAPKPLPSKSLSLPLFFQPNQGHTAPHAKSPPPTPAYHPSPTPH